jgi:hypothetical protein
MLELVYAYQLHSGSTRTFYLPLDSTIQDQARLTVLPDAGLLANHSVKESEYWTRFLLQWFCQHALRQPPLNFGRVVAPHQSIYPSTRYGWAGYRSLADGN